MHKYLLPLLLLALLTGCALIQSPTPLPRDPFFLQLGLDEDKHALTLEGPSRVAPGETITYTLRANNKSTQVWRDDYCVVLVDRRGGVTGISEGAIDLEPSARADFPVQVAFPASLAPDSYALALIIPGKTTSLTTLRINSDAPVPPPGFESPKGCPE